MSNLNNRELPHDLVAEKSLLASLISDNESFDQVLDISLVADDFFHGRYGVVYDAVYDSAVNNFPFDIVSLCAKLNDAGKLEGIGGRSFILEIVEDFVSSAHVGHYAKIVKEKSTLRKVIKNARRVVELGEDFSEGDIQGFLSEVESSFFALTSSSKKASLITLKESLKANLLELQNPSRNEGEISGLSTGFLSLDQKLLGCRPGQLIVLAARPGMGKTSLALNWALNSCRQSNLPVAIYSYEMTSTELSGRILSSEASVDSNRIRTKDYTDVDLRNMANAIGNLSSLPVYINDSGGTTLLDIRSQCRKIKSERDLGMIVIDYLQLMQPHVKKQSREQEIAEISRGLKELAKELECPIMALSQLNRSATSRTDKRPALQDLRESGAIEQDADVVCLIHREEAYDPNTPEKGIAEIIVAKNRAGEPGTVKLAWIGSQTKFAELANSFQESENEYS